MIKSKFFWRTNEAIRATELRVIDAQGKQIGIMPKDKAISLARVKELDLIETVPNAAPPVAKIMDFGKFRYAEEKKLREQTLKSKAAELKEIRFSPFIAENDYNTRLARVKEFLGDGDKVKLVVVFKGRQMGSKGFGYELFGKITKEFGDKIVTDMEPKFLGRHLVMIISPIKKKLTIGEEKDNEKN